MSSPNSRQSSPLMTARAVQAMYEVIDMAYGDVMAREGAPEEALREFLAEQDRDALADLVCRRMSDIPSMTTLRMARIAVDALLGDECHV